MAAYPTPGTPDDEVQALVEVAALAWLESHDVPDSVATSANPFLPIAERAFWRAVASMGRMPMRQS